jgi:hypothetical protein
MKRIITSIFVLLLFTSCNFSKGVKKDLRTGLSTSYNGFSVEDVYMVMNDETVKMNNNTVALGSRIQVVVTGVENFTEENGKVFPGCTIVLTDTQGKELLNLPDAFSDAAAGLNREEATTLRATVTTGDPMQKGATYHLQCRFFDKKNGENKILTDVDLIMN